MLDFISFRKVYIYTYTFYIVQKMQEYKQHFGRINSGNLALPESHFQSVTDQKRNFECEKYFQ